MYSSKTAGSRDRESERTQVSSTLTTQSSAKIRLQVLGAEGFPRSIEFTGLSESEAIRRAVSRGMRVLSIESSASEAAPTRAAQRFPLMLFTQELLALLDAGLNLTEALSTLHAKERHASVRATVGELLRVVREGKNFSDVLANMPQHFPVVYVATVRASERTGDLPQALARYIAYQLQFETIRKKLISASIYPAMLLIVGSFITLFLLGYVVPRFSSVYESSGRAMPWLSSVLLVFGKVIYNHWIMAVLGLISGLCLLGWLISRHEGRAWILNQVLRIPWLSARVDEFRLARFYRAVSLLLAAGIALPRAMGMVTGLLGANQRERLALCRQQVEQGQSLSDALLLAGLASPVAESLIKVGERSGQLAEMLERTARFQDEDFARWIDWTSRLLEPVLMLVIGVVIGTVVVLMYMPIFGLTESL